ncbi:SpoIID/LytB domain-containing protein [bacterium]|nr:SpoIID/LytB domain-containing protein [bacterium]
MKTPVVISSLTLTCLILFRCAAPMAVPPSSPAPVRTKPVKTQKPMPVLRVGLMKGISSIEFSADNGFEIISDEAGFRTRGSADTRWRVEVLESTPGVSAFRLLLDTVTDRKDALERAEQFKRAGYDVEVVPAAAAPQAQYIGLKHSMDYRIYSRRWFSSWDEAREYQKLTWYGSDTHIIRSIMTTAKGKIRLTHLGTGQFRDSIRPLTVQGANFTLYEVSVGSGFHWEHEETRIYPEKIEFTLDMEGRLTVVNKLPLETYLKGVVPSEMPAGFPMEALKAQAVAARGKALANYGIVHASDPFDVCADVHCQVYSGLTKRDPRTDEAVYRTTGIFMMKDDALCDAIFGAVCGGHTEDVEKAWSGEAVPYLRGRLDGSAWLKRYGSLQDEKNLRRWIDDSPNAFCNTQAEKVPDALQYTVKYFRWEVRLDQEELQRNLETRNGVSLGQIIDLVPLSRGLSGRIVQLEIIGTQGSTVIKGELNIRKALSPTTLWSACFYVEKSGWNRVPDAFVLKGAGFGHGVGMCQTGAAMMALKGRKYQHILKHYYKGIKLTKLY